jgi:hypothetical protein
VILSALVSLALVGALNARNYLSHSTMRILPKMTISSSVQVIVHNTVNYKSNLDTTTLE